jgi:hypothetical protein
MTNETRDPRETVLDIQRRIKARGMCGTIYVDAWQEEVMCVLPTPCERHTARRRPND